jgi:hypothetical protein
LTTSAAAVVGAGDDALGGAGGRALLATELGGFEEGAEAFGCVGCDRPALLADDGFKPCDDPFELA